MRIDQRCRCLEAAVVCAIVTLLTSADAAAQDLHKRVLLLFDEDKTLPGLAILDQTIRSTFAAQAGPGIEFFTESMQVSQFSGPDEELVLTEYYAKKYRDRKLDLIIGVMGPALGFLLRYGDTVFPGVPIVFCGADAADLQGRTLPSHVTGLLVQRVFAPTIDTVLRLQPETRRIVVVAGSSPFDRHLLSQARSQFQAFESRVAFDYRTDLSVPALLSSVSQLPAETVIVFVSHLRDGAGRAYVPHEVVSQIASAANAPVYVFVDQFVGRGAVGGHVYSLERHGTSAAEVALQILRGERPSNIPVRALPFTADMFDARELARWQLDERRLPASSIVRFREPSLWDRYWSYIVVGAALVAAQSLLIAGLLIQRQRRRRAEAELRASYERIRNLGGRLLNAQDTERAHLARELHDDISQQMAVLQTDLHTLKGRLDIASSPDEALAPLADASARALVADASGRAAQITRSVRELSHRLHPANLRLLGLTAALRSLQRDLAMQGVTIAFSDDNVPASLSPDVMLCFYRIAQEALNNAVKHGRADQVSVHLAGASGQIVMTIEDNGTGFDVGTVPRGLGLVSMSERVEQVGGQLQVRSQPGTGTHVRVGVPYGKSPATPS